MRRLLEYTVREIRPYINWAYFYHAWQVNGTQHDGREALQADAQRMLDDFDRKLGLAEMYEKADK